MANERSGTLTAYPDKKVNYFLPIITLWGLVAVFGAGLLWAEAGFGESLAGYYLIPWALIAGGIIIAPTVYLYYKGRFDAFHPLTFAAWSYVLPAFVIGGFILAFGWNDPYFLSFIEDPEYNLPLSLVCVSIGFLGLTAGYFLPVGGYLSSLLEKRLPRWEWQPERVWGAGIFLVVAGVGINILGFIQGLLGFQRADQVGIFDGLIYFLVILLSEGMILLWLGIFQSRTRDAAFYLVLILLVALIPARMALLGSRASLLLSVIPIGMAFQYSGRRIKWQHGLVFGGILAAAVAIGIVYGTTFRNIKGSEARMNAGDYAGQVIATVDYLATHDVTRIFEENVTALAERIENLSSLGVVVANYEKLAPYESAYGLENNIVNDLLTSFIPRFVWPDKPPTSDPRAYSELYFNYGENSFAITPFGDLLRNFGMIGIPLGMFVLGMYLRIIYSTLIDTPNPSMWKTVAYYPLLTVVSYEGFYATFFPSMVRVVVVLAVSLIVVQLIIRQSSLRR